MSIFNSIFGSSSGEEFQTSKVNWIPLTDLGQLNEIIEISVDKPVVIFKHSNRCSISRMALKQFENEFDLTQHQVTIYFLDLLAYRDISNAIALNFKVIHQSPQLLLIKNGESVYQVSHSDIEAADLKRWL